MRSLTLKLILAFAAVCIIEAVLVGALVRESTKRSFDRFVQQDAIRTFMEGATAYYETYGTWEGIESSFRPGFATRPPGRRRPGEPPPGEVPRFGLADAAGTIILSNGKYRRGDRASAEVLAAGTPLMIDGAFRGTVLQPARLPDLGLPERQFLEQTDAALVFAAMGALAVALLLGIGIARTYTRPVRELTAATEVLASGKLGYSVDVRTSDELGRLTEAFNRMSADLARSNLLRRQMTADIAHDLRTPLTVLSGYLEAMRHGELEPNADRLARMHEEARHLGRLVEDLQILSLADAGELSLQRQSVAPRSLLEGVRAAFEAQAAEKGIALTVEADHLETEFRVDPDRMTRVLANLVQNALRHTQEGGAITLTASMEGDLVALRVMDTGSGIPDDALPYVFERSYRVDPARATGHGESGLGLAICRSIVEAHGGSIRVASESGRGTTFTIRLPVGPNEDSVG